jgi:alpha-ketoglutaric semialdehyde dehydrogenase
MLQQPVLIGETWRAAAAQGTFQAVNPQSGLALEHEFPVSGWADVDAALNAASCAAPAMAQMSGEHLAAFLDDFAAGIEAASEPLCRAAHEETGLPIAPRLRDVELPRTTGQLRQAAAAARDGSWRRATIDVASNIRSEMAPIGPVCVFGPNNFPFAFNCIAGGDFAAAIAAGNPVIAKANTSHPRTSQLLAECAHQAALKHELPAGAVQLIYRMSHADGARLASDSRVAALAYTGSRPAGLALKSAADAAGKLIYLELSSVNPVVLLPGAVAERGAALVDELAGSCLLGTGQFCTCPNLVVLWAGEAGDGFVAKLTSEFQSRPAGVLLSKSVLTTLTDSVAKLRAAGATLLAGGAALDGAGYRFENTLLRVDARQFLAKAEQLQTEAFGNATLLVTVDDLDQAGAVVRAIEGSLTGSIYSSTRGDDDDFYDRLEPVLRARVGRLLNDKMPTGVAVSPAMNHGGPFPSTGHPGFTAVGIPAAMWRFTALHCYDNVRPSRLPRALQDKNPNGAMWRCIDGQWTRSDVPTA